MFDAFNSMLGQSANSTNPLVIPGPLSYALHRNEKHVSELMAKYTNKRNTKLEEVAKKDPDTKKFILKKDPQTGKETDQVEFISEQAEKDYEQFIIDTLSEPVVMYPYEIRNVEQLAEQCKGDHLM